MYINSVEAAQSGNKTVPFYFFCQNKLLDGRLRKMTDTHINALSITLYPYLPYFEPMANTGIASIIVPILTKSEYLVSLYIVITTRSGITNKIEYLWYLQYI